MSFRFIRYYMDIAKRSAEMSYAKRLKVGAVIVKENKIISTSWNGTPKGWDNTCEHEVDGKLTTKPDVAHAEEMAISKLARDGISCLGSTMYITHAPCMQCARLIYNAGIGLIYYETAYRDSTGIEFLQKHGVCVQKIGDSVEEPQEIPQKPEQKSLRNKMSREEFSSLYNSRKLLLVRKEKCTEDTLRIRPVKVEYGQNPKGFTCTIDCGFASMVSSAYNTESEIIDWCIDSLYNLYSQGVIIRKEEI